MTDRIGIALLLGTILALAPDPSAAETYRWVDGQGNVTYSDRPPQSQDTRTPAPETRPASAALPAPTVTPASAAMPGPAAMPVPAAMPAPEARPMPEAKPARELKAREVTAPEVKTPPAKVPQAKASVPPLAAARTSPTKVDELLELSGLKAQLVGLLSRIAGELRPAPGQMSTSDQASVDRVLGQALRHEAVYALVRDAFRLQVDRPNLEAAATWLRSPVARKIVALEVASSEPGTEPQVATYAASLKASPPAARRVELLQRLDWVTGAHETSADIVAAISRGVSTAVSAAGQPEQRLRPGQIEDRAAQVRARANEGLREVRMTSMLYTYRSLGDEELMEYVLFSGSDAGRWYNAAMRKALVSALGKAVEQTSAELVRTVPLERWARAAMSAPPPLK